MSFGTVAAYCLVWWVGESDYLLPTWWLIVVLFGGAGIPCTQEYSRFKSWHLTKNLTSLSWAPMISFFGGKEWDSVLINLHFYLLFVFSCPLRSVAKITNFLISKTTFTVNSPSLEYLALQKTSSGKILQKTKECRPVGQPENTVIGREKVFCRIIAVIIGGRMTRKVSFIGSTCMNERTHDSLQIPLCWIS